MCVCVCPDASLLTLLSPPPRQTFQIPTMENGPDLAKRFYRELTDIQVREEGAAWWQRPGTAPLCVFLHICFKTSVLFFLLMQYGRTPSEWAPVVV